MPSQDRLTVAYDGTVQDHETAPLTAITGEFARIRALLLPDDASLFIEIDANGVISTEEVLNPLKFPYVTGALMSGDLVKAMIKGKSNQPGNIDVLLELGA